LVTGVSLNYYLGLYKLNKGAVCIYRSSSYGIYDPLKEEWFNLSSSYTDLVDGDVYWTDDKKLYKYNFDTGEFDFVLDKNVRNIHSSPEHFYLEVQGEPSEEYDKDWNFIRQTPGFYFNADSEIKVYAVDDAFWPGPDQYWMNQYDLFMSIDGGNTFTNIKSINGDELTEVFVFKDHVYYRYLSNAVVTPFQSVRPMSIIGRINVNTLETEEVSSNGLEPLSPAVDHIFQRRKNSIYKYVDGSFDEFEI